MKTPTLIKFCLLTVIAYLIPGAGIADEKTALIDKARSAAPPMISGKATIIHHGAVLVEGSNGWTCMPETIPGDNSPHCSDAAWMKLFQAVGEKAPFTPQGVGISYMLAGDQGVSNSDPYHPDPPMAHDFIKEGPHLMIIVPPELLEGMTDDPNKGGPYVMWKDTPYAHIMVPVGKRE